MLFSLDTCHWDVGHREAPNGQGYHDLSSCLYELTEASVPRTPYLIEISIGSQSSPDPTPT